MRDNTQYMGQLIDDLLAFSRLAGSRSPSSLWRQADLVRQALTDLRAMQREQRIDFRIDALPLCLADPALLKQVFVNLLANAIKFTSRREMAIIIVGCHEEQGNPSILSKTTALASI